jgi:hypothetical protein
VRGNGASIAVVISSKSTAWQDGLAGAEDIPANFRHHGRRPGVISLVDGVLQWINAASREQSYGFRRSKSMSDFGSAE